VSSLRSELLFLSGIILHQAFLLTAKVGCSLFAATKAEISEQQIENVAKCLSDEEIRCIWQQA